MDAGPVDAWTVAFSPDSKYIATGSHLGKVNIFGVESGKKEHSLDTRGKFILSIAYSPDGKYLASGAIDGIINIFDIATGKLLHTLEGENRLPHDSSCLQFPLLKRSVDVLSVRVYSLLWPAV
uniref:Superkiller complex protein 8 n=1 Tax=Sinocyclocheilus anshuiensis TaxID=1608454 RepID=A0A671S5Y3_9TELE